MNRRILRWGGSSTIRKKSSESSDSTFRWLLVSSIIFVFELSWFVHNVLENPNWFQFISHALTSMLAAVYPLQPLHLIPDVMISQWGDGVLVFLFFLNLILLRPAARKSKLIMIFFLLMTLIFVHAAGIAVYWVHGGTAASRVNQLVVAAPCGIITTAGFLWWCRPQH